MTGFNSKRMMARQIDQSRLESLMIEAGTDSSGKWMSIDNVEKLFELIVKECADIATMNQFQYDAVGNYVLKHFGVEE